MLVNKDFLPGIWDDAFKCQFLMENVCILIHLGTIISLYIFQGLSKFLKYCVHMV